ncbi:MAG: glycosyltransferase [Chitinophagaceae bacterium]|jgi:glycosyltransferase involved in cell wall biosynthesis|nr:glycosyltransferase [Chitinophagaceae bacterium]
MATPHIICTVTNDLTYDQRMQRICTSLSQAGYEVTLVGIQRPESLPTDQRPYRQVRLPVHPLSGKGFYLNYNRTLYRWLRQEAARLAAQPLAICAIDLDTIIPCYLVSRQFRLPRVYDAHELFTELTEVKRRPWIYAAWRLAERMFVPRYPSGYTVNQFIADEFNRRYGVQYAVIRNMPLPRHQAADSVAGLPTLPSRFFLYQGAVNEGRAFDTLIPAMQQVALPLVIAGNGNYFRQVQALVEKHQLQHKVLLTGHLKPEVLQAITPRAFAGLTLFDNTGLNQYHSLANRFFDYVQAGIPQVCVNYPEYRALNGQHEVALLVNDTTPECLATAMNKLLADNVLYQRLQENARQAAGTWNWLSESARLLSFWQQLFPVH